MPVLVLDDNNLTLCCAVIKDSTGRRYLKILSVDEITAYLNSIEWKEARIENIDYEE